MTDETSAPGGAVPRPERGRHATSRFLEVVRRRPGAVAVFLDFDGTLAPIVDDPAAARPEPGAVAAVSALAARVGRVGVLSGRPVQYLAERLSGAAGTELLGLYGMERMRAGEDRIETAPAAEGFRPAVQGAVAAAEAKAPPGVLVEPKGLTVTLHYRHVPSAGAEVADLAARLADRFGLVAHGGKMSVELRPPVPVDKGSALAGGGAGMEAVMFAGDDLGDLPAFSALHALAEAGVVTLGVAAGGPETPSSVTEAADAVLDGPPAVVDFLRQVAEQAGGPGSG